MKTEKEKDIAVRELEVLIYGADYPEHIPAPDLSRQLRKKARIAHAFESEFHEIQFNGSKAKTSIMLPAWMMNLVDDVARLTDSTRSDIIAMLLTQNIVGIWQEVNHELGLPTSPEDVYRAATIDMEDDE